MTQSKNDSNLKRSKDKDNVRKCIFKPSKFASQKKRVKRIFLISTITNSKFNIFANQKNTNKCGNGGNVKVRETKESVKTQNVYSSRKPNNIESKNLFDKNITQENENPIEDEEADDEIADENQASGIELNARADDFYFEYDFDYDLNEQIKSSDEDFTLYSYNDLLNNNNGPSNVSYLRNGNDTNNAVNGNSSFIDEKDDDEDEIDDEEEDDDIEQEDEEEEEENGQNSESDGCLNEQNEVEQDELKSLDKEKIDKPKEKKFKILNLIVHRLPG